MVPLIVLVFTAALARLVGLAGVSALESWPVAAAVGLFAMFCLTGSAHFIQPRREGMIAMVPPQFAHARHLVTMTGVLELAGAVGLLIPATRSVAAICLAILLVAVFPANVYAARAAVAPRGRTATPLGRRTAYQIVFLSACMFVAFA